MSPIGAVVMISRSAPAGSSGSKAATSLAIPLAVLGSGPERAEPV